MVAALEEDALVEEGVAVTGVGMEEEVEGLAEGEGIITTMMMMMTTMMTTRVLSLDLAANTFCCL